VRVPKLCIMDGENKEDFSGAIVEQQVTPQNVCRDEFCNVTGFFVQICLIIRSQGGQKA